MASGPNSAAYLEAPQVRVPVDSGALIREIASLPGRPDLDAKVSEVASRHGVLPIMEDFMGCWAVHPDGGLVFVAWDDSDHLTPVREHIVDKPGTHVARALGSKRYPNLKGLAPVKTSESVVCPACGGSGIAPVSASSAFVCICGGLGWVTS